MFNTLFFSLFLLPSLYSLQSKRHSQRYVLVSSLLRRASHQVLSVSCYNQNYLYTKVQVREERRREKKKRKKINFDWMKISSQVLDLLLAQYVPPLLLLLYSISSPPCLPSFPSPPICFLLLPPLCLLLILRRQWQTTCRLIKSHSRDPLRLAASSKKVLSSPKFFSLFFLLLLFFFAFCC